MAARSRLLLIGAVCLTLGLFNAVGSLNAYRDDAAIRMDGARAEGHVTRKWIDDSTAADSYLVGYSFAVPGGERIEGQHEIAPSSYRALRVGASIAVLYSPQDPRRNFPEGSATTERGSIYRIVLGVLFAVFGAALVVRQLAGQRLHRPPA